MTLAGFLLLATGAWPARHETEARRVLRRAAATVLVVVGTGLLAALAHRIGPPPISPVSAVDLAQVTAVGVAYAYLAASRGSRFAMRLGLVAAAAGTLRLGLVLDQMAWNSGLARHAYVTIPVLLWRGWTLTAAAFAAGAAGPHEKGGGRVGVRPLAMEPAYAQ